MIKWMIISNLYNYFLYNIINYEKIQYIEMKKTEWSNNMLKKIYNFSTILRN